MTDTTDIRLEAIQNLISDYIASGKDMLMSTQRLLNDILDIIGDKQMDEAPIEEEEQEQKIIISCDASTKTNPGGPAAVGVFIRFPDGKTTSFSKGTPANTNNEAEYDAIYEALLSFANLLNRPKHSIVVRSDSQLVVKQLRGDYKINNEILQRKNDSIHELARALPVPVEIEWHPRNSTPDLTEANFLAQDALGVKRH
jgi:ribonuclease HI